MEKENFSQLKNATYKLKKENEINTYLGKSGWPINESSLFQGISFNNIFFDLCPQEYKDIKEYIETELREKEGHAIGLEIGGTGSNLFSGFTPNFFKKTIGASLEDKRTTDQKERDGETNHSVVLGDAFSSAGFREIKKKLENKKVNVFFEKMHGANEDFPDNLDFLSATLNRWYDLLDDEAIMFIETPNIRDAETVEKIEKSLKKFNSVPGLNISYDIFDRQIGSKSFHIRLQRDETAPADLKSLF